MLGYRYRLPIAELILACRGGVRLHRAGKVNERRGITIRRCDDGKVAGRAELNLARGAIGVIRHGDLIDVVELTRGNAVDNDLHLSYADEFLQAFRPEPCTQRQIGGYLAACP